LSIPGRPPRPVPWIWSQLTLAHNTIVVLSEILYLILKFAVALNLEFMHAAPVPSVGAAERGRTSGLAPAPHDTQQEQSSIGGRGGIKAAKANASFIINNFDSVAGQRSPPQVRATSPTSCRRRKAKAPALRNVHRNPPRLAMRWHNTALRYTKA
jgi:hypothetical protein